MCTLTYLPINDGFIFTHNRDERTDRPSTEKLQKLKVGTQVVYYPKDLEGSGSWIAYSTAGRAVALLNGGSEQYRRKSEYRHSRGLVVLDNFKYDDQANFYQNYNLKDIEPFTMIIRDQSGLWKIVHNENRTDLVELDGNTTGIWSSTSLYTKEIRSKRSEWFYDWLKQEDKPNSEKIRNFHKSAGDGDKENDLIMSRWGILKTTSISQISVEAKQTLFLYEDLVRDSIDELAIANAY